MQQHLLSLTTFRNKKKFSLGVRMTSRKKLSFLVAFATLRANALIFQRLSLHVAQKH